MFAELGRYLHQPFSDVLEWDAEHVFDQHDQIAALLEAEQPRKG